MLATLHMIVGQAWKTSFKKQKHCTPIWQSQSIDMGLKYLWLHGGHARTPTHAKPSRVTIAQFQIPPSQQRCGCGLGCWIPPQSEHSCQGYTQSNCPSARWTTSSQCEPVCTATEPGSSSIDHPAIQASPARSQQWCSNPAPAILLFAWHYPGKSASAHVKKTVLVVLSFYIHMWIACHSA